MHLGPSFDIAALRDEQLRLHRRTVLGSSLTSLAGALLLTLTVRQMHVGTGWLLWLALVAAALLLRAALCARPPSGAAAHARLRAVRLAFALHALAWSSGVLLLAEGPDSALYLAFALLLMSAGALVIASFDLMAGWLFTLLALPGLPLMLWLGLLPLNLPGLCLAGLFIATTGLAALRSHRLFLEHCRSRHAEAAHLRDLQTYQFVVNSIASPVSVVDAELRYHLVNQAWCREAGLRAEDVLGTCPATMVAALDSAECRQALADCIDQGEQRSIEVRVDRPAAGPRWWETSFYPYVQQGWKAAVLVSRDVSARKESAAALSRSLANLELTLNATGDAIFALYADAPDEPLLFCNQRMLQMWDIAPERRADLTLNDVRAQSKPLYVDPAYEAQRIQAIAAAGLPSEDHMTLNDGRVLLRRCIPTTGQGRGIRVWSYRDVSAEAETLRQLQQARELAEQANRAKSDFLASMSHELRTPLNAVLGFGQLLAMDQSLQAPQQRQVEQILHAGRHLLRLIDEVLDLAKIEAGHLHVDLGPVELAPLLDSCLSLVSEAAKHQQLQIVVAPMPGLRLLADPQRLQQVLLNLLSNAIKYNRQGGAVALSWQLEEQENDAQPWLRLSITDTGAGIAPDRLGELFQPFNRLGAERGQIEGTGIGLSITHRLMQAMGGRIEVSSQAGQGSCFSLLLPAL
ncbi:sensor histidine kinase [Paucibacter soli]|uniref:sensor histidine kinase n=1 Tax=Paucibacter soli TaxID=3133433 RepID=UPI0030A621C9